MILPSFSPPAIAAAVPLPPPTGAHEGRGFAQVANGRARRAGPKGCIRDRPRAEGCAGGGLFLTCCGCWRWCCVSGRSRSALCPHLVREPGGQRHPGAGSPVSLPPERARARPPVSPPRLLLGTSGPPGTGVQNVKSSVLTL